MYFCVATQDQTVYENTEKSLYEFLARTIVVFRLCVSFLAKTFEFQNDWKLMEINFSFSNKYF